MCLTNHRQSSQWPQICEEEEEEETNDPPTKVSKKLSEHDLVSKVSERLSGEISFRNRRKQSYEDSDDEHEKDEKLLGNPSGCNNEESENGWRATSLSSFRTISDKVGNQLAQLRAVSNHLTDLASFRMISRRVENALEHVRARVSHFWPSEPSAGLGRELELEMDHVYLDFGDYLWGCTFLGPNAFFLYGKGLIKLLVRERLLRMGLIHPQPHDPALVVGEQCLEGMSHAVYYRRTRQEGTKKIAEFHWQKFPVIDADCNMVVAEDLKIDIDLEGKRMHKASMDGQTLTAKEVMILLAFRTFSSAHVKLHAMGNWGLNPEIYDLELHRNSVISVMYNYFGKTAFCRILTRLYILGISNDEFWKVSSCFNYGLEEGIQKHPQIRELIPYSTAIPFIAKVRNNFLNTFAQHKDYFPGIDGEGFFIGTVLHGLDHQALEWAIADPLWLDADHKDFGAMARLARIVVCGFTSDVPGLFFSTRIKDMKGSFYQEVYQHAAKMDQRLADHMDCCIGK